MCFKFGIAAFITLFISLSISAQSYRGKILDREKNVPLDGAIIIYQMDTLVGISDASGVFETPYSKVSIIYAGYKTQNVRLKIKSQNVFYMQEEVNVLEGVTVTGLSQDQLLLDVASAVTHIDEVSVSRSDQTIISNALNQVPGVYMHSGALNTNRIVIRGMGARTPFSTNKIRAYYGEIPLTDGVGETTIEDIDMSLVSSVDVYKGPNASIYGAGLGGVIHLVPYKGYESKWNAQMGGGIGSFGLQRTNFSLTHTNEDGHLTIGGQHQAHAGYRNNNEYTRNGIHLSGGQRWGKTSISFLAYYVNQYAQIPSSLSIEDYEQSPKQAAFVWDAAQGYEDYDKLLGGITVSQAFEKGGVWKNTIYGNYRNSYEPSPFNILQERVVGLGVRSIFIKSLTAMTELSLGTELYGDRYHWQTYENLYDSNSGMGSLQGDQRTNLTERRGYINAFARLNQKLTEKLTLQVSANINDTKYALDDAGSMSSYDFGAVMSPRLSLHSYLSRNVSIYATVCHGFSPPSLEETLTPQGAINPKIKPELGWNYEMGTRGRLFSRLLNYDLTIYHMNIKNLLVARRTADDQYIGINAGETRHSGIEWALQSDFINRNMVKVSVDMNGNVNAFSFKTFTEEIDGTTANYAGNQLTGVPKWQFGGTLNLQLFDLFYAQFETLAVSDMPITDDNSVYSQSYAISNVLLGVEHKIGKSLSLDLSYRANNVLNEKYASMLAINARSERYYYPGLPVNHQLSLRINVGW